MTTNAETTNRQGSIGNGTDSWHYSSKTGFDLTRPKNPKEGSLEPSVTIKTTTTPITVDPAKSALVIIDMQNFFLSEAFDRKKGAGHHAVSQLVQHAIPAAREAGIRVVWLNWGMSEQDLAEAPPAVKRAFGFELDDGEGCNKHGVPGIFKGIGSECGMVIDPENGKEIDAGRLLTRDAWNSSLFPPLDKIFEEGSKLMTRPDRWMHKNRMSGMWGAKTMCEEFLEAEGIKTLFFAGVNTDQCVGGTMTDCLNKGYDCVFLSDGCGTTSPEFARQCWEFNAENSFGFQTTCRALAEAVAAKR